MAYSFRFLDDIALADLAFEAEGDSVEELFRAATCALLETLADPAMMAALGLTGQDQIVVMVHCGSRGFGHQVASDYLKVFEKAMRRYGISVKDQQLACAPFRSPEGQDYFGAMNCAANTALISS